MFEYWVVLNGTSTFFELENQKNKMIEWGLFKNAKARRRPPSEGGQLWGLFLAVEKISNTRKNLAFQFSFCVLWNFSNKKCLKTNICLFSAPFI